MSAFASFYLIDIAKLDELKHNAEIIVKRSLFSKKITDNYWDYLASNATTLKDFEFSGYIYGDALNYLEEKGIDLMTNQYNDIATDITDKRGSSVYIFTYDQKRQFVDRLDPKIYSLEDIRSFNEDFSETGDEETARYSLQAIGVLRDNLNQLQSDKQVLFLHIG